MHVACGVAALEWRSEAARTGPTLFVPSGGCRSIEAPGRERETPR